MTIPRKALCHTFEAGDYVWTVDPASGRVAQRYITIGELLPGDRIAVNAGLAAGETVAVSGLRFLDEGQVIAPLPEPESETSETHRP